MLSGTISKLTKKVENLFSINGALCVTNAQQSTTERATNTTGAIAKTVAPGKAWQLDEIRVHLSAAGGAGNLTATMDAGAGAAYDTVLITQDMTSVTDLVYIPAFPRTFSATDELDIAWANASNRTYGLEVVYSLL